MLAGWMENGMAATRAPRVGSGLALVLLMVGATVVSSDSLADIHPMPPQAERPVPVAGTCIEPIKPIQPVKPVWCTGNWTQILVCSPNCQRQWQSVCIQQ